MAKEKGILGIFDSTDKLIAGIKKVRGINVRDMDAFTPFPDHHVIEALGLKSSKIPFATLFFGLLGAGLLFWFQTWVAAYAWPVNIGGKPFISWPAFIPITFEGMVLIGGIMTVVTLFAVIKLPNFSNAVLDDRLTDDRFGLFISETDPFFDGDKIENLLKECNVSEIKKI